MSDDLSSTPYGCIAYLVGGIVFLACWAYAIAAYGWFLGLGLGWLPALFIGAIAGALWPLIALAGGVLAFFVYRA